MKEFLEKWRTTKGISAVKGRASRRLNASCNRLTNYREQADFTASRALRRTIHQTMATAWALGNDDTNWAIMRYRPVNLECLAGHRAWSREFGGRRSIEFTMDELLELLYVAGR